MYTTYVILEGDNLYSISQKVLGDSSYAMDIAQINNLEYPFIRGVLEDVPGTVCPGDAIQIPDISTGVYALETDTAVISGDLLLDNVKPGVIPMWGAGNVTSDPHGDVSVCSGVTSLYQDLYHRLMTERGTMLHHPDWGSDITLMIGTKGTGDWRQKIALEVSSVIRSDTRVIRVENINVSEFQFGVKISCDIYHNEGVLSFNMVS